MFNAFPIDFRGKQVNINKNYSYGIVDPTWPDPTRRGKGAKIPTRPGPRFWKPEPDPAREKSPIPALR